MTQHQQLFDQYSSLMEDMANSLTAECQRHGGPNLTVHYRPQLHCFEICHAKVPQPSKTPFLIFGPESLEKLCQATPLTGNQSESERLAWISTTIVPVR